MMECHRADQYISIGCNRGSISDGSWWPVFQSEKSSKGCSFLQLLRKVNLATLYWNNTDEADLLRVPPFSLPMSRGTVHVDRIFKKLPAAAAAVPQ